MVAALLFDLDGTLVDSLHDLAIAVNRVREAFGMSSLTPEAVRPMIGRGARSLIRRALPGRGSEDLEQGLRLFLAYNSRHIADHSRLYPGVTEALDLLAGRGMRLAVVSNKNEELCRLILEALGIADRFEAVCGGDTFSEMKPSPQPLLRVAGQFGAAPRQAAMAGDSVNDIRAGRSAGMVTIGCSWGYGGPGELENADRLAASMEELVTIVAGGG